jgi:purine-binding chemotaxis protein CheW
VDQPRHPEHNAPKGPGNPQAGQDDDDSVRSKYIIFTLEGELYGVQLLQIREVIKMPQIKPVPHTAGWLKGVINLRGKIISVLDLRLKFGIRPSNPDQGLILIAEDAQGLAGAIVDTIELVREIPDEDIEKNPGVDTRIPATQLIGIAKTNNKLVHVLDLGKIVADLRGTATAAPTKTPAQPPEEFKETA